MNIWLPYPNMRLSVHVLDALTLGTQFGDALTILNMLSYSWCAVPLRSHSATLAWENHPQALMLYADYVHREILSRGYSYQLPSPRSADGLKLYSLARQWIVDRPKLPYWIGTPRIHASHRASLLLKDSEWYAQFAWSEVPENRPQWPAKIPRPGDAVSGPDGRVGVVSEMRSDGSMVVLVEGDTVAVEKSAVRRGEWRRCITVW